MDCGHGGKETAGQTEKTALTYTLYRVGAGQWEAAIKHRKSSLALCDDL